MNKRKKRGGAMKFLKKPSRFGGTWYEGEVDGYYVYVRVFEAPSKYGINDGKISALTIYRKKGDSLKDALANYDRGWDGTLPSAKFRPIVDKIVQYFDGRKVDWEWEAQRHKALSD
ncbi:DUF7678 domain-containing protein [Effusibacillus consociatus]|uniref:DUF7678 domain-containing protein n=1 Tax=Effusibacillus consociatus TaxID=1117041 RepID=A0ABV9PYR4_9BACL